MNSKQLYFLLIAVICLLFGLLVGGAYLANSTLNTKADQIAKKRTQVATLEKEQVSLKKAKKDIEKYKSLSLLSKSVVPQDKDQAQTVLELVKIAAANGVRIGSITFPSSTLGATPLKSPATSGTSATSGTGAKANLSQLTPVKDIKGVYNLHITVESDAQALPTYDQFLNFLSSLERNRRTALVSSIAINPDTKDSSRIGFTLTLDEYIKP